jgi:hypothetical protein
MLLTTILTACGAPKPATENAGSEVSDTGGEAAEAGDAEGTEGTENGEGIEKLPQEEDGCPATMKEAKGSCLTPEGKKIPTLCTYPEGKCRCGPPEHCGGMPPDPEEMEKWVWTCKIPPPDVLPDGCPGKLPKPGAPCDDEGKVCWHGGCCTQKIECSGGTWMVGKMTCPP